MTYNEKLFTMLTMKMTALIIMFFCGVFLLVGQEFQYEVYTGDKLAGLMHYELEQHDQHYSATMDMDLEFQMIIAMEYSFHLEGNWDYHGNPISCETLAQGAGVDLGFKVNYTDDGPRVERNKKGRGWQLRDYPEFQGTTVDFYNPPFIEDIFTELNSYWSVDLLDVETDRVREMEFFRRVDTMEPWGQVLILEGYNMLFAYDPVDFTLVYSWVSAMGVESETRLVHRSE